MGKRIMENVQSSFLVGLVTHINKIAGQALLLFTWLVVVLQSVTALDRPLAVCHSDSGPPVPLSAMYVYPVQESTALRTIAISCPQKKVWVEYVRDGSVYEYKCEDPNDFASLVETALANNYSMGRFLHVCKQNGYITDGVKSIENPFLLI